MVPESEKIENKFRRGNHQPHYANIRLEKENISIASMNRQNYKY